MPSESFIQLFDITRSFQCDTRKRWRASVLRLSGSTFVKNCSLLYNATTVATWICQVDCCTNVSNFCICQILESNPTRLFSKFGAHSLYDVNYVDVHESSIPIAEVDHVSRFIRHQTLPFLHLFRYLLYCIIHGSAVRSGIAFPGGLFGLRCQDVELKSSSGDAWGVPWLLFQGLTGDPTGGEGFEWWNALDWSEVAADSESVGCQEEIGGKSKDSQFMAGNYLGNIQHQDDDLSISSMAEGVVIGTSVSRKVVIPGC